MKIYGFVLALINILIFGITSFLIKKNYFKNMYYIQYFWITFTVLTGIWEFFFITNYKSTHSYSITLLQTNSHVWFNKYDISYLLPWNFSKIFYAEYGAYADKLYMAQKGIWSRIIESTHSLFCGLFSFICLMYYKNEKTNTLNNKYVLAMAVAMGSQLMNSILYIGEYLIQINDVHSINYNTYSFPTGFALSKRPFMYINIFWTIMPAYIIISNLI